MGDLNKVKLVDEAAIQGIVVDDSPAWNETDVASSARATAACVDSKITNSPTWSETGAGASAACTDARISSTAGACANAKITNSPVWNETSSAASAACTDARITACANAKVTNTPTWSETTVAPSALAIKTCIDANGAVCNTPLWSETNIAASAGATETRINGKVCYIADNDSLWITCDSTTCTVAPSIWATNSRIQCLIAACALTGVKTTLTLADDATCGINFIFGTVGNGEYTIFSNTDPQTTFVKFMYTCGTPSNATVFASSSNFIASDSDGKINLIQSGNDILFKNRLGSCQTFVVYRFVV